MRLLRLVVGVSASALLATPAGRVAIVAAGALSTTSCHVDCTVGSLMPETLPDGRVGQAYFVQLQVEANGKDCGNRPRYEVTDGVPMGMKVSEDGALDGTPSREGTYSFTVTATVTVDNPNEIVDLRFASRQYELTILPR